MVFVTSDIHGEYDKFIEILKQIQLKDTDTLYVLGDVVDRGPHPIKVLLKLMEMPNALCIVGNHELMALDGLRFLNTKITEESIDSMDSELIGNLIDWQRNGSETTIEEFRNLGPDMRQEIIRYMMEFSMYEEINVDGKNYILVHAGLGNYDPVKDMEDYTLEELTWYRADYDIQYYDDAYVVTGHTPTQLIKNNPKPGYIYKKLNHIAVDCGCTIPGGRLAAICLDTEEEFYSSMC